PIFARRSDESDRRDSPEELSRRKSRGLVGIGERGVLYGGEMSWGVDEREWILRTVLPVSEESERRAFVWPSSMMSLWSVLDWWRSSTPIPSWTSLGKPSAGPRRWTWRREREIG